MMVTVVVLVHVSKKTKGGLSLSWYKPYGIILPILLKHICLNDLIYVLDNVIFKPCWWFVGSLRSCSHGGIN